MQPQHAESDATLIERARAGDEAAFACLVDRHAAAMLRFACLYTSDAALAEDSVQDAWVGFLRGLGRFEGRSSLRTWLFRILLNRLRSRLAREQRSIPFSAWDAVSHGDEGVVAASRFLGRDHPRWPEHWKLPPESWGENPEERLMARETQDLIERSIAALPQAQREVITLRDIEGWSSKEVCSVLHLTDANQRVLLHRARGRIRAALEAYFATESDR